MCVFFKKKNADGTVQCISNHGARMYCSQSWVFLKETHQKGKDDAIAALKQSVTLDNPSDWYASCAYRTGNSWLN